MRGDQEREGKNGELKEGNDTDEARMREWAVREAPFVMCEQISIKKAKYGLGIDLLLKKNW